MILADKIIALRKKAGWSQEELGEKLGVTRQSVSKWEGAQSVPDMDKILQLSRLFGVTTDYLLKDELGEPEYTAEESSPLCIGYPSKKPASIFPCAGQRPQKWLWQRCCAWYALWCCWCWQDSAMGR